MFPYLGKFNLDWDRIEKYYNSISYDDWNAAVSAVDNHATNPFRPIEEQKHYLWYNKHNCLVKNTIVTEQDFFPSFLGEYREDGTKWTQQDIDNTGKKIIRVWIPLMDSKLGHMLYSDEYALASWKKGDVFELPS